MASWLHLRSSSCINHYDHCELSCSGRGQKLDPHIHRWKRAKKPDWRVHMQIQVIPLLRRNRIIGDCCHRLYEHIKFSSLYGHQNNLMAPKIKDQEIMVNGPTCWLYPWSKMSEPDTHQFWKIHPNSPNCSTVMTLWDTCTLFPQIFTLLIKSMETVYLTPAILQMCVDLGQLLHVSYKQTPGNPEPAQVDQMVSWSLHASDIRQPIRVWQLPLDCCSASGSSVDYHPDQKHQHRSYVQSLRPSYGCFC